MSARTREILTLLFAITSLAALACAKGGAGDTEREAANDSVADACTQASVTKAVSDWFAILESGDVQRIAAVVDRPNFHWISVNSFGDGDSNVSMRDYARLADYVRERSAAHERLRLIEVPVGERRGGFLDFGPIVFERSADDLSPGKHRGIGKGEYHCGGGLTTLSVAPAPF
jgi:hypothetical protein